MLFLSIRSSSKTTNAVTAVAVAAEQLLLYRQQQLLLHLSLLRQLQRTVAGRSLQTLLAVQPVPKGIIQQQQQQQRQTQQQVQRKQLAFFVGNFRVCLLRGIWGFPVCAKRWPACRPSCTSACTWASQACMHALVHAAGPPCMHVCMRCWGPAGALEPQGSQLGSQTAAAP